MRQSNFSISPELSEDIPLAEWVTLPSSLHQGGAAILFADGHAINHRWVVPGTRQPVRYEGWFGSEHPQRDTRDFRWLVTWSTEAKWFCWDAPTQPARFG